MNNYNGHNKVDNITIHSEVYPDNMLFILFTHATALPSIIRGKICAECNWSAPTFYRKMRTINEENKLTRFMSNAEKKKVAEIFLEEYNNNTISHLEETIKKII